MAYYKIESNNPDYSYIIEKNPETGLQIKKNKKGLFFFWFSTGEAGYNFNIHFKEASDEMSYPENKYSQFEYLNASKYNDARCLLDVCQTLLHAAREGLHNELERVTKMDSPEFYYTFHINLIETQFKTLDIFERHFSSKGFKFEYTEILPNNYSLTITTVQRTLRDLINLVNLFGLFATLNSPNFYYIQEDMVHKYLKLANYLDAPYFIKYLIKIRLIRKIEHFTLFKSELDTSESFKYDFQYGNTHDMRIAFIKTKINCDRTIIDIGTGEDFQYLKVFSKKMQENSQNYFAIDSDEEARFRITRGIENRMLSNVTVHQSLNEVITIFESYSNDICSLPEVDILCTEVLEHNDMSVATGIIVRVLGNFNINQFIITVPNSDFNKHYSIDRLRHEDHKWEISFEEFKSYIQEILSDEFSELFKVEFCQIGDKVDNDQVSSCAIITKK